MISWKPLWKTLECQGKTPSVLLEGEYAIAKSTLRRIRVGANISSVTIDKICNTLDCSVKDVVEYISLDAEEP